MTLAGLLLLLAGLIYALQYRPVQTYFAKKAAAYLANELHTTISLEGLYFKPFSSLVLSGLYVSDQTGDTLLYAKQLSVSVDLLKLRDRRVIVKALKLADGRFFLKRRADGSNLSFIIDYFRSPSTKSASGRRMMLDIHSIDLANVSLGYQATTDRLHTGGINFNDIRLTALSGRFSDIEFTDHLFKSTVKNLRFREKSGFVLREMNATAIVDTGSMELRDLYIETNRSRVRDYLRLEYGDFSAFGNFMDAVAMELNLDHAQIHSKDIEFFAPSVAVTHFNVGLTGLFTGHVSAITARRVDLQLDHGTRLHGNFTIQGLPDINQTVFDMQLSRLTTNSHEIESLVPQLGRPQVLKLPALFSRLGNLSYQGNLKGLYYDFDVDGTLETDLGTVNTAVNLHIRDGGRYAGQLSSDDFDLGILLQHQEIGHGGFNLTIAGTGFTVHDINSEVDGDIDYLDFRGYRYSSIGIQGKFAELLFAGQVTVDDPNLRLGFDGSINFNPEWPEYAFHAQVDYAHLRNTHLYTTSPIVIENTTIASNFKGNTFNDIQGDIAVRNLRFQVDSQRHTVDSLLLTASGNETYRTLRLKSDIADMTVDGEIDLTRLGSYFSSVAMQYAPALGLDLKPIGKQAFSLNLVLKNYAPIAALLTPNLIISEGARMNARFSAEDRIANVNLLVPKLAHGNIHISRLIVDESANGDALRLLVTADRVSAADSQYINNVNLATVMARDSLHVNLKLSDLTASNRLDFNGTVSFEKDEPIKMRVLPSSLILNNAAWELDENALFRLSKGRLEVQGLQISNNQQVAKLEGILSADTDDQATLTFQHFNLSTLNPFTLPSGIELNGMLNGRMEVSSALKNPYAVADMRAEGVRFNRTDIGNMLLQADFDRVSELINVKLEATRDGIKTVAASGTYNAAAETDKLDIDAQLNRSELVVFQPFLGKLVSDISGTASADLQITGSVLAPQINGTCYLHDAGFTVNYLKTPYRIDDEVSVMNSTLLLNNLAITDSKNNRAVANGKVDMRNPLIPDINVVIDAVNFHVLNTTRRDNPLYYGTAYGTGRFTFIGPTNAMNIGIQAHTDEHTRFYIPLNAVGTVSDNDFIRFISADTLGTSRPQSRLFQGLSMNMDLQITPDAETSLYTDLGELSGRGEGPISLRISSLGDFEMFGDYTINSGKFTFTAQDFINKIFDINQGGTIRWTGQPTEASINLTAVYGQRTSLGPLYNAAGRETVEQRVLAQAEMNLNGNLMRPDITFALNFPNDPYVKDELQSYLSDVNNVNQQALSLIVRRSFTPGSAADLSRELNTTLLSAGTELAFNQLNNLISQSLNLRFVDLNIRSLNEASASVRLFNDRLIFTGGVTDRRNLNDLNVFSDRVVTDAELLYLIRKDGRLVLRGSNRLNSRNFLPLTINENYVSALGLVYRQEFYTFDEFLRRLFSIRGKTEEEEPASGADPKSQ